MGIFVQQYIILYVQGVPKLEGNILPTRSRTKNNTEK